MTVYVELDFLINLIIDAPPSYNEAYNCLFGLFDTYTEFDLYLDREPRDKDEFELVRRFIAEYETVTGNFTLSELESKDFSPPNQTLVFTVKPLNNRDNLESLGALVFSSEDYIEKLEKIIRSVHFELDFSDDEAKTKNWEFIKAYNCIPSNNITIIDNYLFAGDTKLIRDNLHKLLSYLTNDNTRSYHITLLTTLKKASTRNNSPNDEEIKTDIKKQCDKLHSLFAANKEAKVFIGNTELKGSSDFDFHDRHLYTSFTILTSGRGFNIFPTKKYSTLILSSKSIFDKAIYDRLKRHNRLIERYKDKLFRYESNEFVKYPANYRSPALSSILQR